MSTSLTMRQATAATTGTKLADIVKPGVVSGKDSMAVLKHAKDNGYAIPAVNCTCTSVINACLEAAKEADAPIMVQFSNGGGYHMAGKGLDNTDEKAAIAGTIAGALHTRAIADLYGVPVFLHTDHCSKKLLPWFDGLLEANEKYYAEHGVPLFSSHMLDLSEEPIEENMEICKKYLERMSKIDCVLEIEIGITGGEEDGVDNTDVAKEELYSKPEEIDYVYEQLSSISPLFTVAAAFGNVHGVYKPGNVELTPSILGNAQKYIKEKRDLDEDQPVYFVFHGGSGSSRQEIQEAIDYGVVKMNIDTDTQWSMWEGVKAFEADKHDFLQGQIGNPEGDDKPNKKYYDPRAWLRCAEQSTVDRLKVAFDDLKATGACSK
jgi:fructose-bisphosphate aldolase class II